MQSKVKLNVLFV